MATESRRYGLNAQLDIDQILLEAQHRWLRPAEICEILKNYQKFQIAPEPPNTPPNGSLFLFDRKVLRYFRKDGHKWRKKKDGKTVKEAHERLKAGSIDVLHCYYAHGEENENFQRRSYWMLEEEMSHIVLVHYREVKGNRVNFNHVKESQIAIPGYQESEDTTSLNSAVASEYEDAESVYIQQKNPVAHSFLEVQSTMMQKAQDELSVSLYPVPLANDHQGQFSAISGINFPSIVQGNQNRNTANIYVPCQGHGFTSWKNIEETSTARYQPALSSMNSDTISAMHGQEDTTIGFTNNLGNNQKLMNCVYALEEWQTSEGDSLQSSEWSVDKKLNPDQACDFSTKLNEEKLMEFCDFPTKHKHPMQNDLQVQLNNADGGNFAKTKLDSDLNMRINIDHSALKQPLLNGFLRQELKKLDSFDRWINKELEDVNEPHMQTSSGNYWDNVGNEDGVDESTIASQVQRDTYVLSPSLSQEQFFSITEFSPNWAYAGTEIKILITGRFLKSQQEVDQCNWACMFGELEVPAEVISDGVLRCLTPIQKVGRVPFYVTCSNRLACSEVREFEFRVNEIENGNSGSYKESLLNMRFGNLLSLESVSFENSVPGNMDYVSHLTSKINSLLKEDNSEWEHMFPHTSEDQLHQKFLKEKLRFWLLQKVVVGGKGPNVLDESGQGVLHFAAALDYDWAIPPTLVAGVNVNFRDVNGWTALHWAAFCGRERMVVFLIALGAAPGALTDPTPQHPSGRTPADLASSNGHKGIAGYLAEASLSTHLSSLELKENKEDKNGDASGVKAIHVVSERAATPVNDGDWPYGLSLKDSLAAVRNATQAAARIHQVFRVQSFQRKQIKEYGDGEVGLSDERALSLLAVRKNRAGQNNEPLHVAAMRIQNKFRSWKGRKDFLLIRQQIIKIQAHVRGHQVRKNYRKITWSVGILEKVILRWRRKGSGLRGFKSEALAEGHSMQDQPKQEDDYDFLKEGRKQTEERLQTALARVQSMVQYPEARDQYRRLLNVVSEMQETKNKYDRVLKRSGRTYEFDEDLIELEAFLNDDTFMPTAS
ncbi:PREDICTED: calmodulin-binding transcription activator 3-like isoform X2 [Ipomoea nil]|uniref:calmodulin-binding transcription activator 3-like isoform X2 n=1 Tax=Ipomoea nil TaxID=35883 RepID=UPI000901BB7B|nr:PREDICTED: calmodulin-binding transcription activator 3-like isoform X2 [Ipomoea nil]